MTIRHPEKVNKPINLIKKKPDWIKSKLVNSKEFFLTKKIVNQEKIGFIRKEVFLSVGLESRHTCTWKASARQRVQSNQ